MREKVTTWKNDQLRASDPTDFGAKVSINRCLDQRSVFLREKVERY